MSIPLKNHPKLSTLIDLNEVESGALDQLENVLGLPFVERVAVMPDIHQGYGLPIGCVALTKNVLSPAWVGYDIGCGMIAASTGIQFTGSKFESETYRQEVLEKIYEYVPVGFNQREHGFGFLTDPPLVDEELASFVRSKASRQIGTLGSGNHFIEIGVDLHDEIWVVVHTGSRKPGHAIADHFMKKGDYFYIDDPLFTEYSCAMNWAISYAEANRFEIMKEVLGCMEGVPDIQFSLQTAMEESHNHAVRMNDESKMLHRKGATPAFFGDMGIIPGNMSEGTYITMGLGSEEALYSASHGAGRTMSRKKAKKQITMEKLQLDMWGITCNLRESQRDEGPGAYKELDYVMSLQEGINVKTMTKIKPIISVKG